MDRNVLGDDVRDEFVVENALGDGEEDRASERLNEDDDRSAFRDLRLGKDSLNGDQGNLQALMLESANDSQISQ